MRERLSREEDTTSPSENCGIVADEAGMSILSYADQARSRRAVLYASSAAIRSAVLTGSPFAWLMPGPSHMPEAARRI